MKDNLAEKIEKHGLQEWRSQIESVARVCYRLSIGPVDKKMRGMSQCGGYPDLPSDWDYPCDTDWGTGRALTFVAQLSLCDFDFTGTNVPSTGMLYFFMGEIDEEEQAPLIFYSNETSDALKRTAPAGNLELATPPIFPPDEPRPLTADQVLSLPHYNDAWTRETIPWEVIEQYTALWEEYAIMPDHIQVLGYPLMRYANDCLREGELLLLMYAVERKVKWAGWGLHEFIATVPANIKPGLIDDVDLQFY